MINHLKKIVAIGVVLALFFTSCTAPVKEEGPEASQAAGEQSQPVEEAPPQPEPQPEPEPETEEPEAVEHGLPFWAQLYHDYLSKYDLITYTNFHEGPGAVGIGYHEGDETWISVGIEFRELPGYDYPIMISGKFAPDYPNFPDCWYFIEDGKFAEEYVFMMDEIPANYEHLYEMVQGDGYSYPAAKGEVIKEFPFRGGDGYDKAPLLEALAWLESQ